MLGDVIEAEKSINKRQKNNSGLDLSQSELTRQTYDLSHEIRINL
jgi:hypothetical protein